MLKRVLIIPFFLKASITDPSLLIAKRVDQNLKMPVSGSSTIHPQPDYFNIKIRVQQLQDILLLYQVKR